MKLYFPSSVHTYFVKLQTLETLNPAPPTLNLSLPTSIWYQIRFRNSGPRECLLTVFLVWTRPREVSWIKAIGKLGWAGAWWSSRCLLPSSSGFCSTKPVSETVCLGTPSNGIFLPWCSSWPQYLCPAGRKLLANMKGTSLGRMWAETM